VNALGYLRVMFEVDDIDDTLIRLQRHGAELVSTEVVQYEDIYRLCYIRGPGGLLLGLAQDLRLMRDTGTTRMRAGVRPVDAGGRRSNQSAVTTENESDD
jgi:hypothetical protein